jgi:hypothetical protein
MQKVAAHITGTAVGTLQRGRCEELRSPQGRPFAEGNVLAVLE